ncbi:MAG: hypothetical protein A3D10_03775 [Omnitrophica WOR_2 bacterium RIFCSPHIGHO2_02_FULL_48_11]|nr:MAG: hypothetical protein A3D10_03775 [Omnitrophica WOR_2 bacterium RIFCSPHIGHO2_02_FULL_48_11]
MKLSGKDPHKIRLQVFLSHSGVCSRRQAMTIIQSGRVSVNGQKECEPSRSVDPAQDKVSVDGKVVESKAYQYILLNKPKEYVCTKAEFEGEKSVLELLPKDLQHLSPVGRLDKDTEGLLLLTNDGDLAHRLTHPKFEVAKTYYVCVYGILKPEHQKELESGVMIEGEKTSPAKITAVNPYADRTKTEFKMTIHEGKKRQIRLMMAAVGHKVVYLKRLSQGPLQLGNLKTGEWRTLTKEEVKVLL